MKATKIAGLTVLVMLGGCASSDNLNSWQGHNAQQLISVMGEPVQNLSLQDGGKDISYRHDLERNRAVGVQTGGLGRSAPASASTLENTLYCTATFRTDSQGIIVNANTGGNFDACNQFLGTVAAAP
jgi:hypothetical protein